MVTTNCVPKLTVVPASAVTTSTQDYDALVLLYADKNALLQQCKTTFQGVPLAACVDRQQAVDPQFWSSVQLVAVDGAPGNRVVLSPVGPCNRDYDDVRRWAECARAAAKRLLAIKAARPLFVLVSSDSSTLVPGMDRFVEVALLGALQEISQPLEVREWYGTKRGSEAPFQPWQKLGVSVLGTGPKHSSLDLVVQRVHAIELGRIVARDICASDPERMAALKAAEYLRAEFAGIPNVTVEVVQDPEQLKQEYPLLHAVARASLAVERHRPAVVKLRYTSPSPAEVKDSLFLVGKGITYDTGGADVKTGGHMRGMSRDKGGAAAVAGFLRTIGALQPNHVNVTASLAFVRNSVGSDAYVSDEIIVSRAGVRVLVGNTDAEGRMVMADLLGELATEALRIQEQTKSQQCHLFTVATLTGHVIRAYGPYPACLDNGPAQQRGMSLAVAKTGTEWGEPWEVSVLRREDYEMVQPKGYREDVIQCNTAPSTMTARGHHFPAAFMAVAAGVATHGNQEPVAWKRLAYTHMDIAGAAEEDGSASGSLAKCTGAPVTSLAAHFLF